MLKIKKQILIILSISLFFVGCNVQTSQHSHNHESIELSEVEDLINSSSIDKSGDILFHDGEVYSLNDETARQIFEEDPDYPDPGNKCHDWKSAGSTTIDGIYYKIYKCTVCGDYWFKNQGARSIEEIKVEEILTSIEPTYIENGPGDNFLVSAYNPDSTWDSCTITFVDNTRGALAGDCPKGGECNWVHIGYTILPHPSSGYDCKYKIYKCSKCSDRYYRKIGIVE